MTEYVTPNIHSVLKKYQNSAPKSLQGPGHALAAAAAAAAANCLLDVGADVTGSAQSPTELAQLSNGGKCTAAQQTTPAVSLIKKEILSSPEPNEQNETVSTMSGTAAAAAAAAAAIVITTVPPPPPQIYPPPPPELSQPILSMADSGSGELYETRLEGKTIGCFSLGGEMRLCLPQFLNNVLADFTLEQINRIFDELGIYCSQCTPDQLNEFKAAKILPMDVKASGLITRTDAERLCAALLHRSDRNSYIPVESLPKGALSFHVYHKCFGKCEGICTPDMYSYQKPTCIKCLECDGWFSPQKFVGHVHRQFENRTCHWGFDSRNWHDYLHVALDVENREKYQRILDELKEVEIKETLKAQREFDYKKRKADIIVDDPMMPLSLSMGQPGLPPGLVPPPTHQALPASLKHRGELLDIPTKKHKASLDEATAYQLDIQRYQSLMYAHCVQQQRVGQMSAFRPWGPSKSFLHAYNASTVAALSTLPYLSQEPPVLQNPERVVRSTDRERFERTYQPNVALAPRKSILTKEREKEQRDRDRERERERERERIELEREREIERVRQRERSREREREKDRVQELQQQQQQQQQPQHLHLQQHVAAANLSESELHIKQERANTPVDMPQTPPPPPSSSNIDVLHNERHTSNGPIDEHTIGPIALSISQRETRHHNNNNNSHQNSMDVLQSRHHTALNTSNSASTCSSSTPPSAIGALSTPIKQKPMPAHLPHAPPNSQLQQQQQQQQHQRHLQHFPMHQSSPTPPHVATNSLSPEEFSGSSNEITSSTSPVPPSKNNNSSKNNSEHNNKQQNVIATVNQHSKLLPTSSNNNNNNNNTCGSGSNNSIHELPSRIRINRNLINTPNIMRTPTPPTLTPTAASQNAKNNFDYYKQQQQQQYNTQHQQQTSAAQQQQSQLNGSALYREQQPSPTQSSNTGLNLSINAASNAIPLSKQRQQAQPQTLNGTKPHLGSDFELSTDTDDDSLNGEPDSSNMLPPWEMAVEALRDTRPRDRERILHLLQRLLQENHQYRYNNMQLSEMLHKRDAHLIELREELQHCRCELERLLRVQQQNGDDNSTGSSGSGDSSKKTVKLVGNCQADELKEPFKNQLCGAVVDEDCDDEEEDEQKHSEMINGCAKIEPIVTDNKTNDAIRVATEQQQQQPNGVLRRSQTPSNCSNKKDIKRLKIEVEANGNSRESLHDDNSDTEEDTESVDITDNKHKITTGQQQQQQQESEQKSNGNIKSVEQTTAISRRSATGIDEANEIRYTATDASDESAGEETTADEDDMDIDDADEEHQFQQCAQAPHSNALATPPTATTPISPDSAATAGQLFDSSNSSDESSMKQAQMSASDALAKMTSEEAAEPEEEEEDDESVESDDDEENAEANADDDEDTDGDADEVPLQQRQLERQQRKTTTSSTPAAAIVTAGPTVKRRHSSNHDYHLKERTNYGNNCEKLCTTATSNATTMAAMSRTLTMPTKASKKQTPTTNCELQIKKEIV